jgi:hypothetical protein
VWQRWFRILVPAFIGLGAIIGGFLAEALGHLFLDWLLGQLPMGGLTREAIVSYVPAVVIAVVLAYVSYAVGLNVGRQEASDGGSTQDNLRLAEENVKLKHRSEVIAAENDRLSIQIRQKQAENDRLHTQINKLVPEKQDLEANADQLARQNKKLLDEVDSLKAEAANVNPERMTSKVIGFLGSSIMTRQQIVDSLTDQGEDRGKVIAAIGDLIRAGELVQAPLQPTGYLEFKHRDTK